MLIMKSLQESLLDNDDVLFDRMDKTMQIEQWMKTDGDHFEIRDYKINSDCTIDCETINIRNNGSFEEFPYYINFNKVQYVTITGVQNFKSGRGLPKKCKKLVIAESYQLKTLDLPTEDIEELVIFDCPILTTINTNIKSNHIDFLRIWNCPRLENLKNIINNVKQANIVDLSSLPRVLSMKGLPDKINQLNLSHCRNITSIEGCPKHIKEIYPSYGINSNFLEKLKKINNIKD